MAYEATAREVQPGVVDISKGTMAHTLRLILDPINKGKVFVQVLGPFGGLHGSARIPIEAIRSGLDMVSKDEQIDTREALGWPTDR